MDWLRGITDWLLSIVQLLWDGFVAFLNDLWVGIAQSVLMALSGVINSIPVPGFMQNYSLGSIISQFPPELLYFLAFLNLPEAFGIIAAGLAFRMARKVVTLFQW